MAPWRGGGRAGRWTPAVALCVVVLVGGWVSYATYVDPGTHVERRQVDAWSTTAAFTWQTDDEPTARPLGGRLAPLAEPERGPVLDGAFHHRYDGDSGSLAVTVDVWVVVKRRVRSVTTLDWAPTRRVDTRHVSSATPGETVRVPFTLAVGTVRATTESRADRTAAVTEAFVSARVVAVGTVDGQAVSRTTRYRLPVATDGVRFLGDPGPRTRRYPVTRAVTVPDSPGPLRAVGAPLVCLLSALTVVGRLFAWYADQHSGR